uniref:G protein-coupled receptor kinase n=1 Tax=Sinocyclocheilus rhinocerous TaxID=307959 RepID=A0A673LBT8_9TELE
MCDMGGLDNLVANTAYLKDICEQEPIGKTCFRQFLLASSPEYLAAAEFLDELNDWTFAEAGAKELYISKCTNYRGIKLLSVPGKVFNRVLLNRMKDLVDAQLRDQQSLEWNSPLYINFLHYEKAFDSVDRETLWKLLRHYGIPDKIVTIIRNSYEGLNCKVVHGGQLTEHFICVICSVKKNFISAAYSRYRYIATGSYRPIISAKRYIGRALIEMERIIHYTAQIITGILLLHAMDIVYRDMKPENVLLDNQGQCRLSDLGLAVELPNGKTITQKAGTKGYMAPEILKQEPYRTSVDWWALGCSIYEMVAGHLPFRDHKEKVTKEEIVRRTLEDEYKFEHKNVDAPSKDIISLFLKKNIEDHLGCKDDPQKHEFFKSINIPRLIAPPWVPKPNVVYAKDTGNIRDFSEVKGVEFDVNDEKFFKEFSTGAVPIPWQQEMIDSRLFDELNDPNRKKAGPDDDDEQKSKSGAERPIRFDVKAFSHKACKNQ